MRKVIQFSLLNLRKLYRQNYKVLCLLFYFLLALLCSLNTPIMAAVPGVKPSSQSIINQVASPDALLQQGKLLYDAGRFAEAVEVLQQAVKAYQNQGDNLALAATLGNLSLAYQQVGNWTQAQQVISQSLILLKKDANKQNSLIFAQMLDIQGRWQISTGQAEAALITWQQAEKIYTQLNNQNGIVKSLINQSQAWRSQGAYRRAKEILKEVDKKLQLQPDSIAKAVQLRSLGDILLAMGDGEKSQTLLQQSLNIAKNLQSSADIGASYLSLGNNYRTQQNKAQAIADYQNAVEISPFPLTKVQAQLNHLSLLIENGELTAATTLVPGIQSRLAQLPNSRGSIYATINLAQSLNKLVKNPDAYPSISYQDIAPLLVKAIAQSRSLGDRQTEAYAILSLGNLYEQTQQTQEALKLTQQALVLAQTSNAPEIVYRVDWQLGRLLWAKNEIKNAIAAYDAAVDTLQLLRRDLVTVNQNVQFNFRDSVEPVYRESVELLLQSQSEEPDETTLDKARQRIEALQLAELDNFFREACISGQNVPLDKIVDQDNPHTAILYPIILKNQIQVIAKIPKTPLKHYSTAISDTEVNQVIAEMRRSLVNPAATNTVKKRSQQVYNWLIAPIESELSAQQVNTLVFVLDGAFRNIPMASLYDGKKYLIEKYAIALSVGLQLLDPKPLLTQQIRALTAGLTDPPPGYNYFPSLPGIKSEFESIAQSGVTTTSIIDAQFTRPALETKVNTAPFNVVHLATHGQFSSRAEDTFILAADGPINVTQFDSLLRNRDESKPQPVELLVLSACQTAAGDNRAALGLAGTAVRAGARSTIASLWQIDDQSTAFFVGAFYKQLKEGKVTKAQALRNAQLQLLQHPNYNTPSFWSAYVLIGNWL
ncbi:CHAT domain-containing protein [Calothrix sp. FACHB-1219]|uniref:CHAT domain-containing protein n=1 Tax=unclassified Calothrix TaxID=2619626 RepID=UPI001686AD75|nr:MULTISPECIES: CHAT domain-containing protein [unclassified Calothrix]MBD2205466.1 CHAT domain-containing protein [Calothrix sp. FACHB-168]MBD2220128.1 CHAT domain-containing protein [Calothrix sp. FACHB-1219]